MYVYDEYDQQLLNERVAQFKGQMERFADLELLKVKGHAGNYGNEEADRLATTAVRREDSSRKQRKRYPEDEQA